MFRKFLSKFVSNLPQDFGDLSVGSRLNVEGAPCEVVHKSTYSAEHENLVEYEISGHSDYTHIIWNGIEPASSYVRQGCIDLSELTTPQGTAFVEIGDGQVSTAGQKLLYRGEEYRFFDDHKVIRESRGEKEEITIRMYFLYDKSIRMEIGHVVDEAGLRGVIASLLTRLDWEGTALIA